MTGEHAMHKELSSTERSQTMHKQHSKTHLWAVERHPHQDEGISQTLAADADRTVTHV